jgi:hypothetical protein
MMEIIKELRIKERKNKIDINISRGETVSIKLKEKNEMIVGKIVKQRGENFEIEIGRKKTSINISIPKRREIIEEIKL